MNLTRSLPDKWRPSQKFRQTRHENALTQRTDQMNRLISEFTKKVETSSGVEIQVTKLV